MPLVRIDLVRGKSAEYRRTLGDIVYKALIDVINLGGDADSAGAILGALTGAHYGIDAIPDRWLDRLRNREAIDLRAQALEREPADGLNIPDLIENEHDLTAQEAAYRESLMGASQNRGDLGASRWI